jgi:predicted transcriptional regulator YdeE
VVGVSATTGNDNLNMGKTIGGLWEKLYQGGISETIKNKVNELIIHHLLDYNIKVIFQSLNALKT